MSNSESVNQDQAPLFSGARGANMQSVSFVKTFRRFAMAAVVLVVALAGSIVSTPALAQTTKGYVVQFSSTTNPDQAARQLQLLQKTGLKDVRTLSSPLTGRRHIYRVVSRQFATYAEARLAAVEARRILAKSRIRFSGVILHTGRAGAPLIR